MATVADAQKTLQGMARQLQAYSPSVPYSLCKQWITERYRSITENILWSFKVGDSTFSTPAAYSTGTISIPNASAVVTGSGTTFTSAMTGRQLLVSGLVFTFTYTSATTGTIDQTWGGDAISAASYSLVQGYITPTPSDFHSWISVIDPANGWRIRTGYSATELDTIDPRRSSTGTPRLLASRNYSSTGMPMYELWPFSNSAKVYRYLYEKRVVGLIDPTDTPPYIIRAEVLVAGALADLSLWPGTKADPNPMYDPYFNQFKAREARFREEVEKLLVSDQNIYMSDLTFFTEVPYAPLDSNFRQSHAF